MTITKTERSADKFLQKTAEARLKKLLGIKAEARIEKSLVRRKGDRYIWLYSLKTMAIAEGLEVYSWGGRREELEEAIQDAANELRTEIKRASEEPTGYVDTYERLRVQFQNCENFHESGVSKKLGWDGIKALFRETIETTDNLPEAKRTIFKLARGNLGEREDEEA